MTDESRWLNSEATAKYISVRVDALPRLVRQGRFPAGRETVNLQRTSTGIWQSGHPITVYLGGSTPPIWIMVGDIRQEARRCST